MAVVYNEYTFIVIGTSGVTELYNFEHTPNTPLFEGDWWAKVAGCFNNNRPFSLDNDKADRVYRYDVDTKSFKEIERPENI